MRRSSGLRIAPAVIVVVLLTGCATDPASQDLCGQYADVQAAVEELRAAPPLATDNAEDLKASVDELRLRADKVRDQLDQLQRVSEGRLDTAIGLLRQRAVELDESLTVAKYEAAESLGPRVTEARDEVALAYTQLSRLLDAQCPDN